MNKQNIFRNKSILITGGTGSFGSTICKYFLKENVGQIKIFSRDEKKQAEMRLLEILEIMNPLLMLA